MRLICLMQYGDLRLAIGTWLLSKIRMRFHQRPTRALGAIKERAAHRRAQ
jgi:hypothetical protein